MNRFSSIINRFTVLAILLVSFFVEDSIAQETEARVWTTNNGKYSVEAVLLGVEDGKVRLKRSDNSKIALVPIIKLSDADRKYLTSLAKSDDESTPATEEPPVEDPAETDRGKNETASDKPKTDEPKSENPKTDQSQIPSSEPPPRMENPTAEAKPIPTAKEPPIDEEAPTVEQAETKTDDAVPVNPIVPRADASPNTKEAEDRKMTKAAPKTKAELSKPIVPFRSGNSERKKPDMDSNEGVVKTTEPPPFSSGSSDAPKSTSDERKPVSDSSSMRNTGPVKPKPTIGKIDPAHVSAEAIAGDERLKTIDEQKLIESLHLRAELAWKGTVKLNHLLETRKPNFELVIFAENSTALDSAVNVGHVNVTEMVDPSGNTFAPTIFPPSVVNPRKHWVKVDGQRLNRYVSAEEARNSAVVAVEYDRPARMPKKMSMAKGEFKISFATKVQRVTVKNVETNQGQLETTLINDVGLSVMVRQPDNVTLVVEFSGDVHRIASIKTSQGGSKKVALLKAVSKDRGFAQFNFRKPMKDDTNLELEIVTETRELTVPFEFRDVQFNLPDTKTDTTAG